MILLIIIIISNGCGSCNDPCEGISCYPYGECIDGNCQCYPCSSGESCEENFCDNGGSCGDEGCRCRICTEGTWCEKPSARGFTGVFEATFACGISDRHEVKILPLYGDVKLINCMNQSDTFKIETGNVPCTMNIPRQEIINGPRGADEVEGIIYGTANNPGTVIYGLNITLRFFNFGNQIASDECDYNLYRTGN